MQGLVLTAGGARGAYQAGVLKRIGELKGLRHRPSPFAIVSGASAGAINGTAVAAGTLDFHASTARLADLWSGLEVHQVFRADPLTLGCNGLGLVRDLYLGALLGDVKTHSLLDTSPLRDLLRKALPLAGIDRAIHCGALYAVAVQATSYRSGKCFTFVQGRPGHPVWERSRRVTVSAVIEVDHVLASASIPLVFPPVPIVTKAGVLYFGDGGMRLVNPLSPAIRLGADRVLAIGIRCSESAAELSRSELDPESARGTPCEGEGAGTSGPPPLSQVCGVLMNAIFLDHLDSDLDHLERMNDLVGANRLLSHGSDPERPDGTATPMRQIDPLVLNPTDDLAIIARSFEHRMPRLIRHVMEGLGRPDAQSADLMSYLLFDGAYTSTLVDVGYRDADARADEIEHWLLAERREQTPPSVVVHEAAGSAP